MGGNFKQYDIIFPNKAVQYDCTVRETEPLIKEKFNVNIDITIVDTEASGIAYVCKMNNVKIIIIKGISDFPTDESLSTKELSHEKQYNCFVQNIPIIMNKIFNDYIEKVI